MFSTFAVYFIVLIYDSISCSTPRTDKLLLNHLLLYMYCLTSISMTLLCRIFSLVLYSPNMKVIWFSSISIFFVYDVIRKLLYSSTLGGILFPLMFKCLKFRINVFLCVCYLTSSNFQSYSSILRLLLQDYIFCNLTSNYFIWRHEFSRIKSSKLNHHKQTKSSTFRFFPILTFSRFWNLLRLWHSQLWKETHTGCDRSAEDAHFS